MTTHNELILSLSNKTCPEVSLIKNKDIQESTLCYPVEQTLKEGYVWLNLGALESN